MYVSRNWSTREWDCYGRDANAYAWDNEDGKLCTEEEGTMKLFKILDMLRDWNPNWVVNWTNDGWKSGYRTPYVNEMVGGVENSNHVMGCAADIHEYDTDATSEELANTISAAARYCGLEHEIELGIYLDQGWCHLGTPGYRNVYFA